MQQTVPIQVNHLFKILDDKLIELLSSLAEDEWQKPTIAKLWTVKDVAAHLLDTRFRSISILRDKHLINSSVNIQSYQDLVAYLNDLNADWVNAMKRVSPQLLIELFQATSNDFVNLIKALPPHEKSMFSVAWAGEEESYNWFHVAREYTEIFIHQQQVRNAVGKEGIITKELFYPFIDTFMYGMPYTFRNTLADDGTTVRITITSDAGGDWFLTRNPNGWQLSKTATQNISSKIFIGTDTAWKLFSKGINPEQAKPLVTIEGDIVLGEKVLDLVAVMA